jgi:hypothetical protein
LRASNHFEKYTEAEVASRVVEEPAGHHFDGGSGEEIGGEGDERDVINANLIKDMDHGLRIRLRDPKALRRGLDGPTRGLEQPVEVLMGAKAVKQTCRSDGLSPKVNLMDQESLSSNKKRPRQIRTSPAIKKTKSSPEPCGRSPKDLLKVTNLIYKAIEKLHPKRIKDFLVGTIPQLRLDVVTKEGRWGGKRGDEKTILQ